MSNLWEMALKVQIGGNMALLEKAGEIGESIGKGAITGYHTVEKGVVGGYKKIEKGTVNGYKMIEEGVVGAYRMIEDAFVGRFLTHEVETVEDAKKRLTGQLAAHRYPSN